MGKALTWKRPGDLWNSVEAAASPACPPRIGVRGLVGDRRAGLLLTGGAGQTGDGASLKPMPSVECRPGFHS